MMLAHNRAIPWSELRIGENRLTCPACGRSDKDKTLGVTISQDGSGVAHCFRCQYVETWRERAVVNRPGKVPARLVAAAPVKDDGRYLREVRSATTGLRGTVGEQYLHARGCALPPVDSDLRFHPNLRHFPSGRSGPALVGLITHAITREPMGLHRTWITATGKADVDPPRMVFGAKQEGVIRLWPDDFVLRGLAIAEGIETALSIAHEYRPVWSVIDAGNMAVLPVLPVIETLIIGADNDAAGRKGSLACADRWALSGVDVRILVPPADGADWNDLSSEVAE